MAKCHNCGKRFQAVAKPVLRDPIPREIAGMVPSVVQCPHCESTFSTQAVQMDTATYHRQVRRYVATVMAGIS